MLGNEKIEKIVKIIVVSKDLVLHDSMEHMLDSEKYILKPVVPNPKSIARVRNNDPDIFIIDGSDPGEKVLSICQTIRTYSGKPILVLAANSRPELVEKVLDAGADEFLLKPVSGKILAAYLNNLIRRARAENDAALILVSGNDGQTQSSRLLTY
jgi:DNA-binding response OmpR family regulator